jgi:predicted nucleic acid-binding protein
MVKTITINDEVYRDKSADIMGRLLKAGKPVNKIDVLISGIALANGIEEIITKDSDFKTIEGIYGHPRISLL